MLTNPCTMQPHSLTAFAKTKDGSRAFCCLSGRNGGIILKPSNPMQNYIIIAQSILEEGVLGRIREVQTIAAPSSTEALAAFQFQTLRGKGSFLNDDHDLLHWEGLQFTAMTYEDLSHEQVEDDEDEDETLDLEDRLAFALDPIDEKLARLKEVLQ